MLGLIAVAASVATIPTFVEKRCEHVEERTRCGIVSVPENRAHPLGRRIALNVVVIPAAKPSTKRQALFDLEGGPGLADTKNVQFYLTDGAAYAETRDVVLVDQRGTGESNPLDCPEFDVADQMLRPMFPLAAVRACRAKLSRTADLARYTTEDAVADLDDVRKAFDYSKIDIFALSYGTTLALRYIAEHGEHVRSAVLLSAVPPSAMPPRHHAEAAQSALDQLMRDCRSDPACNNGYPILASDLAKLRSEVTNSSVAMERLRTKLYSPAGARSLPWMIHRLAVGDTSVLTSSNERAGFNYYDGVYLTITCSESLPWFDQRRASAQSRRTMFGDYRLARQRQACSSWPRARVKPGFFAPIHTSVPVLFLSGARDPVTPPSWAARTSRGFPNSRHIVIPWAGHIVDGLTGLDTCFDPQVLRFLAAADTDAVDAECISAMAPPPFRVTN